MYAIRSYYDGKAICATDSALYIGGFNAEGWLMVRYSTNSGGQYLDGTTDITRTVAIGPAGDEERRAFTLVLKGMIAISRARFPRGLSGADLRITSYNVCYTKLLRRQTGHRVPRGHPALGAAQSSYNFV